MDNKKRLPFAKLILAAIIFISFGTVFGVTVYLIKSKSILNSQPQISSTPEPTPTPIVKDETSDWKTYRNEKYGFEIKYPTTTIYNGLGFYPIEKMDDYIVVIQGSLSGEIKNPYSPYPFMGGLGIKVIKPVTSDPVEELKNKMRESHMTEEFIEDRIKEVIIGKLIPAVRVKNSGNKFEGYDIYIKRQDEIIMISFDNPGKDYYLEIFEKMLSTFKFIEPQTSCVGKEGDEQVSCIGSYLSQNPISDDVAKFDDKLKDYFSQAFNLKEPVEISRGKFDNQSNDNVIIISFDYQENASTHIFIIKEVAKGKWQAYYQNLGVFEKFTNNPLQLVKNKSSFFAGLNSPISGTCVGGEDVSSIYRLENNEFKSVWSIVTFSEDVGRYSENPSEADKTNTAEVDTKLNFKDINNDGNKEIIRQGAEKVWKGYCNPGGDKDAIKIEKIYEVYKWDSQKQTFIKIN